MATYEKDYNLQDKPVRCTGCFDGPKSCDICGDGYNELTPNQLVYTLKELQVCYDTEHLIMLFQGLLEEGYTGLSLGLVIDLIKQRLETLDKRETSKETKSYSGYLSIPFDVENIDASKEIDTIINGALDKLGEIDLGPFTWDNPDWVVHEIEKN